ncbi:nickel-responsive transcriptional regulator NikR [Pseudooceanicola sp. CBS1P-1]|uniref:Putative nickel-responsive regulator n=1 Tax=Pseudooceanicola albus TaxID=2692189 RepID=A0A6L7G158_9RHOB|nr:MULTISPECIES: nickel-responsive transcriptional regulator NikR [Pseudooceanicola]MBT9383577.1 nickel-responsive transcriptional regulator NikR [Pseudooceanicola endophyticus]MXN17432.1 nickel-responsive transcriptional regulator NikR [Pseudooceanicola albus]
MQRVTVTLDDELMAELDALMRERGYANRSEAIRDMTRAGLARARVEAAPETPCIAALIYTYDHHSREVSQRLTSAHHDHHDLAVSSLHVHLDHHTCLEVSILKGQVGEVRHFTDHLVAQRNVQNGEVVIIPSAPRDGA